MSCDCFLCTAPGFDWQYAHCFLDVISSQNGILILSMQISATKADLDLSFMIQTCFISTNSNHEVPSDYVLIENICPRDESVRYYHQKLDRKRFSFDFRSKFTVPLLFLHCEMSVCSKRHNMHSGLPEVWSFTFPQSSPVLYSALLSSPVVYSALFFCPLLSSILLSSSVLSCPLLCSPVRSCLLFCSPLLSSALLSSPLLFSHLHSCPFLSSPLLSSPLHLFPSCFSFLLNPFLSHFLFLVFLLSLFCDV